MEADIVEEDIDGAIESVHVRNFFCHDNLEINFNRNVNFIVGRNGSGKSAILTALVVGLGGRASATNRGSNLHSFIKKGANSATIEIKIKNNSSKAYKHDLYGDYITIVRHITSSGASNYKVKSATGEVISTKFEEVNAIILAHDIQVDNPISVLNQDDARSFHASDAKKKYSLFRKATNLDQTETNYVRAKENCNKAVDIWNRKTVACIELEREYKKWKTSHEQLQSRDEIEAKKQALQNEYYWSEIAQFEQEVSIVEVQYNKQKAAIEKVTEKLNHMMENNGSSSDLITTFQQQMAEKSTERSTLEREMCELESQMREVQMSLRSAQNATAKHKELLNRENRKVADLEREIQNIQTGSAASQRAALEQRAQSAHEAAAAVRARYDTAQHDVEQSRAAATHAHALADRAAAAANRHADILKQLKQQLRELESRGSDSLAVYGNNMVVFCQKVKEAVAKGHFSAPPRGPVGAYIKVKEKKWGGALEHIIGGSVRSFCVNTAEDSRKLFEIMGKVFGTGAKPSVTCSQFLQKVHDVRRHAVQATGYRSALDSLLVSDPVIANYLIDNVGLEKVLLVPEHEDAIRLSDTAENVPMNCSKIVTLDCTEYHPAPNYRCYGGAARPARYLHLSTTERKAQLLAEIEETESTYHTLKAKAEEANRAGEEARVNAAESSRALQALLSERHQKDEACRVAVAALDQQQTPHHAVLVDELNVSKEKLCSLAQQLHQLTTQEQECQQKCDNYDVRIRKAKETLGELSSACRTIREEIEQEQLKLDHCLTERRTYQEKLKEDKAKVAKIEVILKERRAIIDKKIQEALTLCPRIENPRELSVVTAELKKTRLKLLSIRSDGLTRAQVAERLLDVERKYRQTKHTLDRLKTLIDQIQITADKHLKFCHTVQTYIARRVQYCFQSILTLRGYSGCMDIDNARCALEIRCTGREASSKRHAASTSSLSGGERSYSTVAFIMALWECVELPFYFMDEFDVFMDNVNRKIVMELLVDHALNNTSRQFVFLTPQDASAVTASDRITIHLMADPRP